MTTTLTIEELEMSGERELGTSSWHDITQEQVNMFAEATGDRQWIHVDPLRAAGGLFGGTVAHGYLTLSLIPGLLGELMTIADGTSLVNYGIEKVRFPAPVRTGSRVRLGALLVAAEPRDGGVLCRFGVTVELEGSTKPALAGEILFLAS
jgi:acyl dehydratase